MPRFGRYAVVMRNSPPAVQCTACAYEWRSEAMADGLRMIGSCPRCGGELAFASAAPAAAIVDTPEQLAADHDGRPAHMILGMPRGW
jgi:hypothetical protein